MADQPERMYCISETQLSVARYYGGCTFNGADYVYIPKEDMLIRADILAKENAAKRKAKKEGKD
jgi:hypothetical protein